MVHKGGTITLITAGMDYFRTGDSVRQTRALRRQTAYRRRVALADATQVPTLPSLARPRVRALERRSMVPAARIAQEGGPGRGHVGERLGGAVSKPILRREGVVLRHIQAIVQSVSACGCRDTVERTWSQHRRDPIPGKLGLIQTVRKPGGFHNAHCRLGRKGSGRCSDDYGCSVETGGKR